MLTQKNQNGDEIASSHFVFHLAKDRRTEIACSSEHEQLLCLLAHDIEVDVRLSLLDNSFLSSMIFAILAEDEHPDVRYAVAEDYRSPYKVLERLISDENPYVAHRAGLTMQRLSLSVAA